MLLSWLAWLAWLVRLARLLGDAFEPWWVVEARLLSLMRLNLEALER